MIRYRNRLTGQEVVIHDADRRFLEKCGPGEWDRVTPRTLREFVTDEVEA